MIRSLVLLVLGAGFFVAVAVSALSKSPAAARTVESVAVKTGQSSAKPALLFDESAIPGEYYFGDGLGVNCSLKINADHTFKFSWHGCLGEYDRNIGSWSIDADVLALKLDQPNNCVGFEGVNLRFIPVKWGPRYYLVDEYEMPGFCVMVRGADPHMLGDIHGHDYVKWTGDRKLPPVTGKPIIPERFKDFYARGPVEAKVIAIDAGGNAILNGGSANRLRTGMLLTTSGFGRSEIRVDSISGDKATARPFYYWNTSKDEKVKVGQTFTTGGTWSRPRGTGTRRFAKVLTAKELAALEASASAERMKKLEPVIREEVELQLKAGSRKEQK